MMHRLTASLLLLLALPLGAATEPNPSMRQLSYRRERPLLAEGEGAIRVRLYLRLQNRAGRPGVSFYGSSPGS